MMPVRIISTDEWHPSIVIERRLRDFEKEGLLLLIFGNAIRK